VRSHGEPETYQRHERCDGMYDEDGRQGMSRACGQREVGVLVGAEELLWVIVSWGLLSVSAPSSGRSVPVLYPIMGPLHTPSLQ
jgi:hypothetical protein